MSPKLDIDLIFITGVARVGKSHAAMLLEEHYSADAFHLSDTLKDMTHAHYGVSYVTDHFDEVKDLPSDVFHGKTPREAYIDFSENIMKKRYGNDALGQWSLKRIAKNIKDGRMTIIPGVGFIEEVRPIVDLVGPDRIVNLEIEPMFGVDIPAVYDSRTCIRWSDLGIASFSVENSFTQDFAEIINDTLIFSDAPHLASPDRCLTRMGL